MRLRDYILLRDCDFNIQDIEIPNMNDEEKETITTDITQVIKEVQAEAPVEVTFNLLKIGTTATVVSWVIETGNSSVI